MAINKDYFYNALENAGLRAETALDIAKKKADQEAQDAQYKRFISGLPAYLAAQTENTPESIAAMTRKVADLRQANPEAFARYDKTGGASGAGAGGGTTTTVGSNASPTGITDYLTSLGLGAPSGTSGAGGGAVQSPPQAATLTTPSGAPAGTSGATSLPPSAMTDPLAGGTAYAPGTAPGGGNPAAQAISVIQGLLGSGNPAEVNRISAENAYGGGYGGSNFGGAQGYRLQQSEIDKRNELGLKYLDPYLQRQEETFKTIEEGRQAKQRLDESEAGLTARLTQQDKDKLEQIALEGQNAIAKENLTGQYDLAGKRIAGSTAANVAGINADKAYELGLLKQPQQQNISPGVQDWIRRLLGGATGGAAKPSPVAPPSTGNYYTDSAYNQDLDFLTGQTDTPYAWD